MEGIIISAFIFITLLISVMVLKFASTNENDSCLISVTSIIGSFMGMSMLFLINSTSEYLAGDVPSALDVYRGNTELKITKTVVNDSITKCDTTVVFK